MTGTYTNMGYDRIILIVAVVMCRAAVLQVLSQTTTPGTTNSTTAQLFRNTTNATDSYTTATVEPGCETTRIFPNCSYCNSSDIYDDTWVCRACIDGYDKQDEELCSSPMANATSKRCCVHVKDKKIILIIVGASLGGCLILIIFVIVIVAICRRHKRKRKRSRQPPQPPPVNTNTVHTDADGTRYRFDRKGNKVFDVDPDLEMDDRPPMAPPLNVPHPPLPDDSNQVYDNDLDQVRIERQPQPPRLPGQLHLPKLPLPTHQKPLNSGEPPRVPPPVPIKDRNQTTAAALRPPNPPPKPTTPSHQRSKLQPPAPPKPKPKPAVPRNIGHTSPSPQGDFQETYEIPDAEKHDFGETYDDVASDNNAFDWQESYDDVSSPHQEQPESDGEDYEPVPKPTVQTPPHSLFGHITQESIIRDYGDDKLYQNQPVLDSKTKTSYRYRNLAMTKGEKIESEMPYLVKR